ncbi:hypothetical protein C475_12717 [Halosimplex carlsbadense 2-9-1]|uniref:Uncharacterized protein n=1 Tax=Halosimplex carlsbadense 2-9-1 TaxID=797114 RepID=M0CLJ3_9EURY|nr:hypothetical protein [Halosimplex carlsbadense]ELZ24111.1 hypothetical protein C475_12717 [Halosimplex carlsbadense 2-9-1]
MSAEMDGDRSPDTGPAFPGSAVAVVAAVGAMALLATDPLGLAVVAVAGTGAGTLLLGGYLRFRGRRVVGLLALTAGLATVLVAVGLATVYPAGWVTRVSLVFGTVGPGVLAAALVPLRRSWAGRLVGLATALLVGAVALRGFLSGTGRVSLLVALAGVVVAWDAAEHAVGLGADVGRGAVTVGVSATHLVGSLSVGLVAVVAAVGLYAIGPSSVPLVSVVALLAAVVGLLAALAVDHVPAGDGVDLEP